MNHLKEILRSTLGNSRGYTINDVLVGVIATGALSWLAIGVISIVQGLGPNGDSDMLNLGFVILLLGLAAGAGLGIYAMLRKRRAAATKTSQS